MFYKVPQKKLNSRCLELTPTTGNNSNMQDIKPILSTLNAIIQLCMAATKDNSVTSQPREPNQNLNQTTLYVTDYFNQDLQRSFETLRRLVFDMNIANEEKDALIQRTYLTFKKMQAGYANKDNNSLATAGELCSPASVSAINDRLECNLNDPDMKNVRRVQRLSKKTIFFLDQVYARKRMLNSKERMVVARKTGLSSTQVKNWFSNKRMRSK